VPAKTPAAEPWTKGRPTLYKGIRMRSRLEADYAADLDRCGLTWEYEPECFAGDGLQWVPDFHESNLDANGHGRDAWVEIKPAVLMEREAGVDHIGRIDKILTRMSVAWLSKPDAWLELTFWVYGEGVAPFRIAAEKGMPWILYGPTLKGFHPLWPGMGQFEALDHRWDGVAASAR
jgi:hypothetical protein